MAFRLRTRQGEGLVLRLLNATKGREDVNGVCGGFGRLVASFSSVRGPASERAGSALSGPLAGIGRGRASVASSVTSTCLAAGATARGPASTVVSNASRKAASMFSTASRAASTKMASTTSTVVSNASRKAASMFSTATASATASATLVEGLTGSQRRAIAWWLGGSSAWVFSMVVLGGITRLTRSGLSMTDWKFTGEKPPGSEAEWTAEFERYKQSPEFRRVNISMSLDEFKFIYWMEWAHRMWGRGLGVAFALPLAFFTLTGAMTRPLASRLALLFTMGGTQAFVGWWMVRSGLQEPESPHHVPRVSPYRLAAHLTSAFAIYAVMVWTTLSIALPEPLSVAIQKMQKMPNMAMAMARLRARVVPFAGLLSVTALSGAFVAGLDAGHAYNTFPLMGGKLIPDEYWGRDAAGNELSLWRNAFENTASVQFHHRCLALTTLLGSMALWKYGTALSSLPRAPRLLLHALALGTGCQVALGVTTLLTHVPVSLGSAHQAGALSLFTISLALIHCLRSPTRSAAQATLYRLAGPAAAVGVVGAGSLAAFS